MRIYLVRHGETVHNVAQAWAGATDSALTNHGMLQIECLAQHFMKKSIRLDWVFASDLSRARITAEGICRLQPPTPDGVPLCPVLTRELRERDFGSLEGLRWQPASFNSGSTSASSGSSSDGATATHVDKESTVSMRQRANSFLHSHFLPVVFDSGCLHPNIAIVAHGIILRVLWNCLVELFDPMNISLLPGVATWNGGPAALISPSWSNTGVMELLIQRNSGMQPPQDVGSHVPQAALSSAIEATPSPKSTQEEYLQNTLLHGWSMSIQAIDNKAHLSGLRRTRGGIGSASHDTKQKKIDQFFK
ncbi:hypothetical protein N7462_005613 [Penicillium macrosclerotiorum]|uniref:uncharacterized protein n=1 Tax=Penicillium macrosclerotiorum TaxID=303699 RepID=UPI002549303F|nr:uncharacterized protein N7462_005613 [Penicillium macrosclerotiorum]KAJ5682448.1 hypothetical protein N7462_005613 [Penicillium macrosclerotiorum]